MIRAINWRGREATPSLMRFDYKRPRPVNKIIFSTPSHGRVSLLRSQRFANVIQASLRRACFFGHSRQTSGRFRSSIPSVAIGSGWAVAVRDYSVLPLSRFEVTCCIRRSKLFRLFAFSIRKYLRAYSPSVAASGSLQTRQWSKRLGSPDSARTRTSLYRDVHRGHAKSTA